jgi:branched-chain amino acid transport system substrate-binding protein
LQTINLVIGKIRSQWVGLTGSLSPVLRYNWNLYRKESSMKRLLGLLLLFFVAMSAANAEITVGVVLGATGPGASLGIPTKNAFPLMPSTIAGEKVRFIILDDATDPTNAVKNARRLTSEDNVDVLMGSVTTPTATAIVQVAAETKTPLLAMAPLAGALNPWAFQVPFPQRIATAPLVEHMKATGVKTVAYIGFSDALGDSIYDALVPQFQRADIKLVANERYARTETSVVGQVVKILASKADAVVVGASATPAALPPLTLKERGYKGQIYLTTPAVTKDFLRVGGKSVEGVMSSSGVVPVAEQLPDSHPLKKNAVDFNKRYEELYGAGSRNQFSAQVYDGCQLLVRAVPVALKKAKPGTAEFRQALRDAIESAKEVLGATAIYNMSPTDHEGVDGRVMILVRVEDGQWKLFNWKKD